MAFEYGVEHGGPYKDFIDDCHLQSGNSKAGCDGVQWNLDLYVKGGKFSCPGVIGIGIVIGEIILYDLVVTYC